MAYSDYNYIQPSELPTYIHTMSSVTDETLAAKHISDAERIVDAYVGPGPKFYVDLSGETSSAVASGATTLPSTIFGSRRPNYWARGGVYVELVDGVAASLVGERRLVVASDDNQVTLASGFDAAVANGALFVYRQLSAFPRVWDQHATLALPRLPEGLKRATAFQVEYAITFGSEAFGLGDPSISDGEAALVQSRTYGSGYSETRIPTSKQGLAYLIAPRARAELYRLINAAGRTRG